MKPAVFAFVLCLTVACGVTYAMEPLSVAADGPRSQAEPLKTLMIGFAPFFGSDPSSSFATVLYSETSGAIDVEGDRNLDLLSDSDVQRAGDRLERGFHHAAMQITRDHEADIGLWGSIATDSTEFGITVQLTLAQLGGLGYLKLVSTVGAGELEVAVPENRISFVMSVIDRLALVPGFAMARRESTMRSEPSRSSGASLGATKAGEALSVLDVKPGWIKVRAETGREAYLAASDVDLAPRSIEITQDTPVTRIDPAGPDLPVPFLIKVGSYSVGGMRRVPGKGLWYAIQSGDRVWLPATSVHARFSVPAVHFIAGLYALHAHNFRDAVHSFEQFINEASVDETNVTLSVAQRLRGIAALASRFAGAIQDPTTPELLAPFKAAADLTPYDPGTLALLALARLAIRSGSDAAVADLTAALDLDHQDPVAKQLLLQLSAVSVPGSPVAAVLGLDTVRERLMALKGHEGPMVPRSLLAMAADVTTPRLLNANKEPQNWLQVNKDYAAHRYSELDQINKNNVKDLHVAFTVALGGTVGVTKIPFGGHQSTPLVDDGAMYVVNGLGVVYRIDVRDPAKAKIVWMMDPGTNKLEMFLSSNRGVALYKNFVVSVTGDCKVLWTNRDTGELVKTVQFDDPKKTHCTLTSAPLVIDDKLIVGGSGGDQGARAHIDAFNADSGELLWRTYAVPAPGEPGSETWKGDSNAWEHGGGSFRVTGSYDPKTKLTIWGTGQPVPMFDPEYRPGDNLFTDSTLGLDVNTGKIVWYFQYTPGDFLDYDEVGINQLIDTKVNGEDRNIIAHFGRNGFFYTLDSNNGQFLSAAQYAQKVNWTDGIDPRTGKPIEYDPKKDLQTYKIGKASRREQGTLEGCPNLQGGVNFMMPASYSERTRLSYSGGIEGCSNITPDPLNDASGDFWLGGKFANAEEIKGSVTAMNPATGKKVAQLPTDHPVYSGVTSTAGGLLFTTTADGTIYALDDETLKPLWSFNAGSFSSAPPMTYAVNGKQCVAVLMGGNNVTRDLLNKPPSLKDLQNTPMLFVFSL
jgi:alcohol dehydrogenase (cytochrome c)